MRKSFWNMRNALDRHAALAIEEQEKREEIQKNAIYSDAWKQQRLDDLNREYKGKTEFEAESAERYAREFQDKANEYLAGQALETGEQANIVTIISALSPEDAVKDPVAYSDTLYTMADLVLRYKDNKKALRTISSTARARAIAGDGGAKDRLEEYARAEQAVSSLVETVIRRTASGISAIGDAESAEQFSRIAKVFPVGTRENRIDENDLGRALSDDEREAVNMLSLRKAAGLPIFGN